ncbi:isocitrate lyase/PEP mutase family protein [Agromyces subbeticus]|uniref:isocitrate lyase/PEP mutase family protein n=1 Tax=Agromyces subbeticus TaxID=293890 RepID=UPI0003B51A7B|nr:isocitrate lyase/phosphoenolpyruvate mutase family protein [Agromyces subbeticus]
MLTPNEFRALHRPGTPFVLPNAWDLASARWLHAAGHRAIGTTSLGIAVAAGKGDGAGDIAAASLVLAERAAEHGIALSVDLEAGCSDDPDEVGRLAAELAMIGCVGVNIEDSDTAGRLVDPELASAKVAAIAAAAPALYLNARADPFWVEAGGDTDDRRSDAVARARSYLAAGATGVFVPGVLAESMISSLAAEIPAPLNVLVQPGLALPRLAQLRVARVSTGSLLFRTALGAATTALASLTGSAEDGSSHVPSYAELAGLPLAQS